MPILNAYYYRHNKMPIIKFGEKESNIYQNMCPPWRCIFSL